MTSLRIAIYVFIALHFLRVTARKLSPDRPRKPPVVDESLGVLPSIPSGLIKNERECLKALAPTYVNYVPVLLNQPLKGLS